MRFRKRRHARIIGSTLNTRRRNSGGEFFAASPRYRRCVHSCQERITRYPDGQSPYPMIGGNHAIYPLELVAAAPWPSDKGVGSRMRCRLLNLPAPNQEPKHEEQFPEERDKSESKIGIRKKVWPQAIDHPAESIALTCSPTLVQGQSASDRWSFVP